MHPIRLLVASASSVLVGCAGSGEGLDASGRPAGESDSMLLPTFDSIQTNVLTPICTPCHAGAAAPVGLSLESDVSYAMLVNAPSAEVSALLRVQPGDPDASYLMHKIEGRAAVGGRMPLGGPPLPSATIAVIRQWIVEGAQAPAVDDVSSKTLLTAVTPTHNAPLTSDMSAVLVQSNEAIDVALLQADVINVIASGGDGEFVSGNERAVPIEASVRSQNPFVLAISPIQPWREDMYQLTISGSPPIALADLTATAIDGDADGLPGGDFVLRFRVEIQR